LLEANVNLKKQKMAKDINMTSGKWNDIIFEGKNKDYGAYEMRQSSSRRHIIALIAAALIILFISSLPFLIRTVTPKKKASDNLSESTVLADLQKELEEQVQEKNIIREEAAPPPPPLKSTIQFTAPEIVDASQITDDDEIKSQDELTDSKVQISVATVEGTDDEKAIDIADLLEHKVIAEEEDKVFDIVEQSPEFPGGMDNLTNYLNKNIRYPSEALRNRIQGTVIVKFVVRRDGNISDVQIIRSPHKFLEKEAIRVVAAMPRWIPGKQGGNSVNVSFALPIEFVLK
jgi:protein TonB